MTTGHFTAPIWGADGIDTEFTHDGKEIDVEHQEHAIESTLTNERIQNDLQYDLNDPSSVSAVKKYLWRLDFMILPTISACYFFAYLDRGNVAVCRPVTVISQLHLINRQNAKLLGLSAGHDTAKAGVGPGKLALSAKQWDVVIMITYVGLIMFQIPGCIGFRLFSPSRVRNLSIPTCPDL